MSESINDLLATEDADAGFAKPTENYKELLQELVGKAMSLEAEVELLELQMKEKNTALLELTDREIPRLMSDYGQTSAKLVNGIEVKITDNIQAKIADDSAYEWLQQNGLDDIIDNKVVATFKRGEDDEAAAIFNQLKEAGVEDVGQSRSIHHSRLKAFVRDHLKRQAEGEELPQLPLEAFGVFQGKRAEIKIKTK